MTLIDDTADQAKWPCSMRGRRIATKHSNLCSQRGKEVAVYACEVKGWCTVKLANTAQDRQHTCMECADRPGSTKAQSHFANIKPPEFTD